MGLFNCVTLEMTRGILLAAEALQSPVIIGPAESLLPGAPLEDYADMMRGMAARARVPVALQLRPRVHAELVKKAVDLGFTSVMFDGSMLPFADNARLSGSWAPMRAAAAAPSRRRSATWAPTARPRTR